MWDKRQKSSHLTLFSLALLTIATGFLLFSLKNHLFLDFQICHNKLTVKSTWSLPSFLLVAFIISLLDSHRLDWKFLVHPIELVLFSICSQHFGIRKAYVPHFLWLFHNIYRSYPLFLFFV